MERTSAALVSSLLQQIEARRAELLRLMQERRAAYDRAERELKELDRELCGMAGGLAELARVQAIVEADEMAAELGMAH